LRFSPVSLSRPLGAERGIVNHKGAWEFGSFFIQGAGPRCQTNARPASFVQEDGGVRFMGAPSVFVGEDLAAQ
jgi:hypothetical protein